MRDKAFKVHKVSNLSELKEGDFISESDLALQHQDRIVQFKYIHSNKKITKKSIKPGIWQIGRSSSGICLKDLDFSKKRVLTDMINTQMISDEFNFFFKKIDVYKELGIQPKRGCLLFSSPGIGKTTAISMFCQNAVKEDVGTVVLVWPTGKIDADDIQEFLATETKYASSCTRVILIIEDIGGGNVEGYSGPRKVDSGILNMLDGVGNVFKLPTFIVATTNHPEQLMASLSDRPGRFDRFIELLPPSPEERVRLFEFVAKRSATEEEATAIKDKKANGLSAAHITEIVIRHRLTDKSIYVIVKEMLEHSLNVKNNFSINTDIGFNED